MEEEKFQEVYDLYTTCEKQPVCVLKDITGMIANRLLHAQAREAFHLVEIGAATAEDVDKALKYGPCFRNATTGMLEVATWAVWMYGLPVRTTCFRHWTTPIMHAMQCVTL